MVKKGDAMKQFKRRMRADDQIDGRIEGGYLDAPLSVKPVKMKPAPAKKTKTKKKK